MDLSIHRIPGPSNAFYIPNFVTVDEEAYIVRKISESPKHKWKSLANRRLQLLGGDITRNVLFAQAMPPYVNDYPDLISRLQSTGAFGSSPHKSPNHIILNEYLPGQGIFPHEDGPSYYPVVATITLGSHAIFNYYRYKTDESAAEQSAEPAARIGQAVDINPIFSVFLEPRSVIITTAGLYESHLHGIDELVADTVVPTIKEGAPIVGGHQSVIANWDMLGAEELRKTMQEGGVLRRETRYSLTCRDVQKVASSKTLLRR